eukprot:CAMPEP_0181448406 /NCGR_PEP_ID=MMETSP1110-20121109/27124_1 /TAXON_ID=174948 /ORGANISM="Symbiodinium sp., Strain CCMP421" /LENGTH=256 /DNA_ID=CAMNT_0023572555 /DNA_START=38 /DNA_END=808 /DNA_ORIENTATION=-
MASSVIIFAVCFFAVVVGAASLMAYVAWRGSKQSEFFLEAVQERYECELSLAEINAYYDLKDRMQKQKAPDLPEDDEEAQDAWIREKLTLEERRVLQQALMKRLVSCFDRLDQVQRDKPGNFNLWRQKLVSERYWASLLEAEQLVSEEISSCVAEAGILEPGWNTQIFNQAVHIWRMQKQQVAEKKEVKKDKEKEKKEKEKAEKRKEIEAKLAEEEKARQEKLAQKAMDALLKEEEASGKAGAKQRAGPKSKSKKK